jgi:hypothetical protein
MEALIGWHFYFSLCDRMSVKIMTNGETHCSLTRAPCVPMDTHRFVGRKGLAEIRGGSGLSSQNTRYAALHTAPHVITRVSKFSK